MDLRHVVDRVLLIDTKKLAGREREIMSQALHHLLRQTHLGMANTFCRDHDLSVEDKLQELQCHAIMPEAILSNLWSLTF